MSEVRARDKFSCPACGGEARWDPARTALVCPYCGTVSPAELSASGGEIQEHDLATALRRPMTEHAAALAGDSVSEMRRTGRNVIAIYDAGVGR